MNALADRVEVSTIDALKDELGSQIRRNSDQSRQIADLEADKEHLLDQWRELSNILKVDPARGMYVSNGVLDAVLQLMAQNAVLETKVGALERREARS